MWTIARCLVGMGGALVLVVTGAPLPAPSPVVAQESFDIELGDLRAWAEDAGTVGFEVEIEAIGDSGSPPGEVVARWETDPVGSWPLEARDYAEGALLFSGFISVPDGWVGSSGRLEVEVSTPGDVNDDNNMVWQIVDLPEARSDLAPTDVWLDDVTGRRVVLAGEVVNQGAGSSEPTDVAVYVDGDYVGAAELPAIPSGDYAVYSITLELGPGVWFAEALVDPGDRVAEADEDNNWAGAEFQVEGAPDDEPAAPRERGPDLVLFDLWLADERDGRVVLEGDVVNEGDGPSDATEVAVYADGDSVGATELPAIPPGDYATFSITFELGPGTWFVEAQADPADRVAEADEDNNRAGTELQVAGAPADQPGAGSGNGPDPTWVLIGGGAVATVGALELLRRRRWRRRHEAQATDETPRGRCRPGTVHTTRSCRPEPKLRKVTGIGVAATDRDRRRPPLRAEFDKTPARRAVAAALRHRRRRHDRRLGRKLDEAAGALAGEIVGLLPGGGAGWDVELVGNYEGGKIECTFRHWKCDRSGTWPGKLLKEWTGTVTDQGAVVIGQLAVFDRRPVEDLVTELRPLLARFVETVCETTHPLPAGIGARVDL